MSEVAAPPALRVVVQPTATALMTWAAEQIVASAAAAIAARGRFALALSGGTTPRALYQRLATPAVAGRISWRHVHVFWGDERCVPATDPASNYRMTANALLDVVPIPPSNIHRIHGEDDPRRAAAAYERELVAALPASVVPVSDGSVSRPRFDLVLLGLGDDGHTASLFPGLTAVHESTRLVVAEPVPQVGMWRVSLTPVVINAAAAVVFLVSGTAKAEMVRQILEEPRVPAARPAQVVAPDAGTVTWLLDADAAARLAHTRTRLPPGA